MATSVTQLFIEASDLADGDRAALAGLLLESIEPVAEAGVDLAWEVEVERRVKQLESGEVKGIPWEEVRAKLWMRARAD